MIRDRSALSDVVITWPRGSRRIARILQTGRCPSHARPLLARKRATVALVDPTGVVMALFQLKRIDRPRPVVGASGKRYENGCELVAEPGTMRRPRAGDHQILSPAKHIGAIRYFDDRTGERVWYGGDPPSKLQPPTDGTRSVRRRYVRLIPYRADTSGTELARPEADLVERYVQWLGGSPQRFACGRLQRVALFIDLFVRSANLLVEAKANIDRDTIRHAVGQLYDYRRYFRRPPRLSLLLPGRPSSSIQEFLSSRRIHCIWETETGRFGDSVEGQITRALRRPPAAAG